MGMNEEKEIADDILFSRMGKEICVAGDELEEGISRRFCCVRCSKVLRKWRMKDGGHELSAHLKSQYWRMLLNELNSKI